ncbi:MAG TPA: Dabb family protein [Candidatus Angelobacter sp.]|nr:Dabb family protein [Candidatus Angelobacter sp.]
MLTHVVSFTFVEAEDRHEGRARLEALPAQIPAIRSLTTGLDVLGDAGAAHLVLVTTHDDVAGLRAYQQHPVHQEFGAWLAPRLAAKTVVDFES